jgi:agmatinase
MNGHRLDAALNQRKARTSVISPEKLDRIRALAEKDFTDFCEPILAQYLRETAPEMQLLDASSLPTPPRFAGEANLLGAPRSANTAGLDIALVGVPYDLGVTNRPGPRFGPKQMRAMSYLAVNGPSVHETTKVAPFLLCKVADIGDMGFRSLHDIDSSVDDIYNYFKRLVDHGITPLTAGGDHSISYPILKALGEKRPLGMVHIDAHADTLGPMEGTRFHHGAPFLNAAVDGVLDPERTIQIGIRGPSAILWGFSHATGMRVIGMEEADSMGVDAIIAEARRVIGDGPTYVSVDVDAMDPAFTPGTGTPEVGGFTPIQVQRILRGLRGANLIGGDVVEVSPPFDASGGTAMVAGRMMWELLCLLAEARHLRAGL